MGISGGGGEAPMLSHMEEYDPSGISCILM